MVVNTKRRAVKVTAKNVVSVTCSFMLDDAQRVNLRERSARDGVSSDVVLVELAKRGILDALRVEV